MNYRDGTAVASVPTSEWSYPGHGFLVLDDDKMTFRYSDADEIAATQHAKAEASAGIHE
jgi:hypothetical protein